MLVPVNLPSPVGSCVAAGFPAGVVESGLQLLHDPASTVCGHTPMASGLHGGFARPVGDRAREE